jgi:hypothetical protein
MRLRIACRLRLAQTVVTAFGPAHDACYVLDIAARRGGARRCAAAALHAAPPQTLRSRRLLTRLLRARSGDDALVACSLSNFTARALARAAARLSAACV